MMGDLGHFAGGLAHTNLRRGREQRQLLLDGLELGDRPPELQV